MRGGGAVFRKSKSNTMKLNKRALVIGLIEKCPKCNRLMERRKHPFIPIPKSDLRNHYFSEWDYCKRCNHVQHYERYKVLFKKAL